MGRTKIIRVPIEQTTPDEFLEAYNQLCNLTGLQISAVPILAPGDKGYTIALQFQVVPKPPRME